MTRSLSNRDCLLYSHPSLCLPASFKLRLCETVKVTGVEFFPFFVEWEQSATVAALGKIYGKPPKVRYLRASIAIR